MIRKDNSLTVDEAMSRLDVIADYDAGSGPGPCVHTFRSFLGAHWYLDSVRTAFEKHGVEEAGEIAKSMGHGVAIVDDCGPVFFATKPEA